MRLQNTTTLMLAMITSLGLTACGSIRSKVYDTDNVTSRERQIQCFKGIPETIDVPTHIVLRVEKTHYLTGEPKKEPAPKENTTMGGNNRSGELQTVGNVATPREELEAELQKTKMRLEALLKATNEQIENGKVVEQVKKHTESINELTNQIKKINDQLSKLPASAEPNTTAQVKIGR